MWGRPKVRLTGDIAKHLAEVTIHVSLTHEGGTPRPRSPFWKQARWKHDPAEDVPLNMSHRACLYGETPCLRTGAN